MTRSTLLHRRAALALCITAVSLDAGCAHFRNAEERAAAARAAPPPGEPALAEAPPPPTPAPYRAAPQPAPAPAPLPEPAPSAPQPAPPPAAEQPRAAPEPAPPPQPVPPPQVAAREAIPEPVAPSPAPAAPAVDNTPSSVLGPATGDAIIVFANTPGAGCVTCETVKITVTPTGTVLMERGFWTGNHTGWHYKRSVHHVGAAPAAAFAASLNADRPVGAQALASSTSCAGSGDDGLAIEWIEADRHDRLTLTPSCPSGGNSQIAQRLRHAPDVLRLRGSPWPWETGAQTSSR